jgi:hypothetical protein
VDQQSSEGSPSLSERMVEKNHPCVEKLRNLSGSTCIEEKNHPYVELLMLRTPRTTEVVLPSIS